jgi:replicative DNA helicase
MVNTRVLPQDIDTEKALLGSIMLNTNAMYEIADSISPESFYASKHKIIFDAMLSLFSKGDPIDLVTLSGKLKEKKQIKSIGGAAYLSELVDNVASPTSAPHYAQIVKGKHMLRNLIEAADHIGNLGFEEARDIEDVLEDAQAKVFSVTNSPTLRKFTAIGDALGEAW